MNPRRPSSLLGYLVLMGVEAHSTPSTKMLPLQRAATRVFWSAGELEHSSSTPSYHLLAYAKNRPLYLYRMLVHIRFQEI
ncbi:hypothetical protein DEU56DRAFT_843375 [Suillus clintonianus]|uniref:uncharacterized protein n=1 Tax=Suillus clintonianus TaxID=1904413 RepID=UPI001B866B53|nr:uncharacterized protein DEU56DRAFT_843375 [Suillus clintonianus]KAG2111738.1 hypothetical protein DEU56DRAFT_843375 [Suillus clintonianus]